MPTNDDLNAYANVVVEQGLALRAGDRLVIEAPIETASFIRRVVERAYAVGAVNVDVLWLDDDVTRARFVHGSEEASQVVTDLTRLKVAAFEGGASFLYLLAQDPSALDGVDLARVKAFQQANGPLLRAAREGQMTGRDTWCIAAAPVAAWATTVFDTDPDDAVERLWTSILRTARVDHDDPIDAWRTHGADLVARREHLTSRRYQELRYEGPGTDLVVGLGEGAIWAGGPVTTNDGRLHFPNLPTEEVFTSPHRLQASGVVTATKPLSYFGQLVEGFRLELSDGRVVGATAERGQDVLDEILSTDEGSVRFGEVAMVPQSSTVSAENLVWNNMLFDENDGCHIALGLGFPTCLEGAVDMTPDERLAAGLNQSDIHVDFVVGSPELSVFGRRDDGTEEPILLDGEWGFEVG